MIGGWVVPMGPLGRGGGYRADAGSWKGAWANPPGTAFAEETSTWLATYILYGGSFLLEKKRNPSVQREECNKYLVVRSCAPKVREKIKELKKTVPQSTEIHASEKSRKRQPFTPIQNICGQPR